MKNFSPHRHLGLPQPFELILDIWLGVGIVLGIGGMVALIHDLPEIFDLFIKCIK